MAIQCPICHKNFISNAALSNHQGHSSDASIQRAYPCPKCGRKFCSQKAMEQHRDAPAHATWFSCETCKRTFGSKKVAEQHKDSTSHSRRLARERVAVAHLASVPLHLESEPAFQVHTTSTSGPWSVLPPNILELVPPTTGIHTPKMTRKSQAETRPIWQRGYVETTWDMDEDQDWSICDKDCGWCGHCADGLDI